MTPHNETRRLYWQSGGTIVGFHGVPVEPAAAERIRNGYLAASVQAGPDTNAGRSFTRAARELHTAMTEAGKWARASGCVSDLGRSRAA